MNARFENPPRYSAAGVTTAALLIVMLAMAASTLFTPEPSALQVTAGVAPVRVAQAHHLGPVKKI
jgi:hypothetical protein